MPSASKYKYDPAGAEHRYRSSAPTSEIQVHCLFSSYLCTSCLQVNPVSRPLGCTSSVLLKILGSAQPAQVPGQAFTTVQLRTRQPIRTGLPRFVGVGSNRTHILACLHCTTCTYITCTMPILVKQFSNTNREDQYVLVLRCVVITVPNMLSTPARPELFFMCLVMVAVVVQECGPSTHLQ